MAFNAEKGVFDCFKLIDCLFLYGLLTKLYGDLYRRTNDAKILFLA